MVGKVPSTSRPRRSPAISCRSASAAASWRMTLRACSTRTCPASVGDIPRAWRFISGCPTSRSSRRSCWETADGVYIRASAAAVTDPSSTTDNRT